MAINVGKEYRPHRLLIPFVALLALVLSVVFFHGLEAHGVTADTAAFWSAVFAFIVVTIIGFAFKPLLGE